MLLILVSWNILLILKAFCNAFIICGDFNTSFSRANAQTTYLSDCIHRYKLTCPWGHNNSKPDFTSNIALNHKSCIDHPIVTKNVYDNIHLYHIYYPK